jgi:hypothetical protein
MPELLTRAEMPNPSPAGWPASNRNGGRIYFGMAADIKSERWPASSRNTRPASIGIRSQPLFLSHSPIFRANFTGDKPIRAMWGRLSLYNKT